MALRDVKEYYLKEMEQYVSIARDLKDVENDYKEGNMTQEQYDNIVATLNPIIYNLNVLTYILYLFNLPKDKKHRAEYIKQNNKYVKKLSSFNATQPQLLDDSIDAIKKFKELVNKEEI